MVESADSRGHGRDGLRDPDCEEVHGKLGLRARIGKQHAHIAVPGDAGKTCSAGQTIFNRLRVQPFVPEQVQQRTGIEIPGAGRARDSPQRSERHGGVAAPTVLDGADAATTPPRCAKTARLRKIPASWLATTRSAEAKASPWKP